MVQLRLRLRRDTTANTELSAYVANAEHTIADTNTISNFVARSASRFKNGITANHSTTLNAAIRATNVPQPAVHIRG